MNLRFLVVSLLALLTLTFGVPAMANDGKKTDLENTLYLDVKDGRVVIELLPEKAPKHVARIKELARKGFYDGIVFHRVIEGFMAQTGDPTGTGAGGSGTKLKAEFNDVPHVRGVVSMARAGDPDSADSQFFIVLADSNYLDGQYTAWGRVVEGMEAVDKIKKGNRFMNGKVDNPDKIIKLQVAADAEKAEAAPAAVNQ
jgi:peptidylprolyl isomerase